MFSLPSLAPTDAHTLWYQSSSTISPAAPTPSTPSPSQPAPHRRANTTNPRTPLTRLRLDEEYIALRKLHITTYGSTWLKPPGLPKTLHQLREEEREARDHAEALRREQLAQELAEAEARDEEVVQEADLSEEEEAEVQDLDADIPDADAVPEESSLVSSSSEEEEEEEEEEPHTPPPQAPRAPIPNTPTGERDLQSPATRARIGSGMLRGERLSHTQAQNARWMVHTQALRAPPRIEMPLELEEEEEEPPSPSQMLLESDLYHEHPHPHHHHHAQEAGDEEEMDLDAEIPDADAMEGGGYEHTDSDEELSSSEEEESEGEAVQGMGRGMGGGGGGFATSIVRSDGTQNSMDFNGVGRSSGFSQASESALRGGRRS